MNPDALPRTRAVIEQGIAEGLHLGAQVYVSRPQGIVADLAIGEARRGVPMTPSTLISWMSSGKPVAAVAIAQLYERGLVQFDDPVARYIPEFAQHNKDAITLEHLLTHTGGFRVSPPWDDTPWEKIIERICRARLEPGWIPGQKAGYHLASSWYILGEIVRRLDGRPYEQYVREAIFAPLGMNDSWIGMPLSQYHTYGERMAWMYNTQNGIAEPSPESQIQSAVICRPGGSGHGPIRELGFFYEMLRDRDSAGTRQILQKSTIEMLIAPHRVGMHDVTFDYVMNWGWGFILNSNPAGQDLMPYGYGPYASPRAFGHGGHQSSGGMCDPDFELVITFAFNSFPGESPHQERRSALFRAIYHDLQLA